MIDGVVKDAVNDAIRFLRDGDWHIVDIDTHEIVIVKLTESAPGSRSRHYLVVCKTCSELVVDRHAKPFIAISKHIDTGPESLDQVIRV